MIIGCIIMNELTSANIMNSALWKPRISRQY